MAVALNERDAMSYFRLSGAHNMNGAVMGVQAARKSTELKGDLAVWLELEQNGVAVPETKPR